MGKKNKQNNNNKDNGAIKNQDGEEKKEEANQKKNKDNNNNASCCKEVVLKVYMHCEGCSNKVSDSFKCFPGVTEVVTESENNKVFVKGKNLDAIKVLERLQKKYSKNSELISPIPKPDDIITVEKVPEKAKEPQVKTVVLKMLMHCEGCEKDIKRNLEEFTGVVMVEVDMEASVVTVKGVFDSAKIVEFISKRMGKHVQIVEQEQEEKEEENKRKEEKSKKEGKKKEENDEIKMFHYPPQYATQYVYPCQTFSDENVNSCSVM